MPLIERDVAVDALPVLAEFRPIMLDAWAEWMELPASFRSRVTASARAFSVHDLMVDLAARRLSAFARIIDKTGLKLFVFADTISIRIKKHDEDLTSRNQPTEQVKALLDQQQLEGVPAVHHLEMGYVLDPSQTAIASTNLVCPNGRGNRPYWHIELKDEGYQFQATDLFDRSRNAQQESESVSGAGSRWKKRESGIVIPFKRTVDPDGQS
jgi:hypothetical protein